MVQDLGFVDIHCHLLPAIDDGSKSWDETLAMARMAVADGIRTIVVTPHQLGSFSHNHGDTIRALAAEVQNFLNEHKVPLTVSPGGDVRIEPGMVRLLRSGQVMTLADRRKHVLLELPHEIYLPLEHLLDELVGSGMVGILSHPERNLGILADSSVIRPLVEAGCLMQVTAGSLVGAFGPQVQAFTEWMVTEGYVHFVSTDAHGTKSRRPLLSPAHQRVIELAGVDLADEVCKHNPAAVAAGQAVVAGRRKVSRPKRAGWWGWKKAG
jgi:protein-tyrosine phosphatase